eukprot:199220_1
MMDENDTNKCEMSPYILHRFTPQQLCHHIKQWILNDIDYKSHLSQTMRIFSEYKLSGQNMRLESTHSVKCIVKKALLSFMTDDTFDIMFNCYEEWNNEDPQDVESKSARQIGDILFHYPLNNLLRRINDETIDGVQFIRLLREDNVDIIGDATGWDEDEVNQIQSVLFRHHICTESEFQKNMNHIFSTKYKGILPNVVINQIKKAMYEFDTEEIHYQIKNGMSIDAFSTRMIFLVQQFVNKEDQDLVQNMYEAIAQCFVFETEYWTCNNCGNCNFPNVINNKMRITITICTLCGMSQREQIMSKIRGRTISDHQKNNDLHFEKTPDDIDLDIQTAIHHGAFYLSCPNQNNNRHCESILRLTKTLIQYKRHLYRINGIYKGNNTNKTVHIGKYVDDNAFKSVITQCIQSIEIMTGNELKLIIKIIENNRNNTADIGTFLKNRKAFITTLQERAKISASAARRLYLETSKALRETAKINRIETENVDNDTFKQTFIASAQFIQNQTVLLTNFFEDVVDDITSFLEVDALEFAKNVSKKKRIHVGTGKKLYTKIYDALQKKIQRMQFVEFLSELDVDRISKDYHHVLKVHMDNGSKRNVENSRRFFQHTVHYEDTASEIAQCMSLDGDEKETNVQVQLNTIHSDLVHSDWRHFILGTSHHDEDMNAQAHNETNIDAKYHFGINHCHLKVNHVYDSIYDELLFNKIHHLSPVVIHNEFCKAADKAECSLSISKMYDCEYNILRNEAIGIRHVFAIKIYSAHGCSDFVAKFRSTYRQTSNSESMEHVTQRHRELYYYARSLYESVHFFGDNVDTPITAYHGLDSVLYFERFTSYFFQPISTTTELSVAHQFSQGQGMILILTTALDYLRPSGKQMRYFDVSWISAFPNEQELLFYGPCVAFQVTDIITFKPGALVPHTEELRMLRAFEKILNGQQVNWEKESHSEMLRILIKERLMEANCNTIFDERITEFGRALFNYFCAHTKTKYQLTNIL